MILLETQLPMPGYCFFILAMVCFLIAMFCVMSVGKGRPHS